MLTFLKDLGTKKRNPESKQKRRYYLVHCSGCDNTHEIQASQFKAGYTNWCNECGKKHRNGN